VSPGGRRPGNVDTREEIIEAARLVFAEKGYENASLRAVARGAGVDPALVHHYFDGKSALFIAAMSLPFDPRTVKEEANPDSGRAFSGAATVEGFLTMWDRAEGTGSSFASCAAAMATSVAVADAMREFVSERVWRVSPAIDDEDEQTFWQRRALISSHLMGLAFNRYVLRMPPLSTAAPSEIGRWVGPTLDRYVNGPLS
jgi:AcrR family transcriptional regulator